MKLVRLDSRGRMDVAHLRERIQQATSHSHPVMMVVTVAGTTELGVVDPIGETCATIKESGFIWHHVDAAYGGFFAAMGQDKDSGISEEVMEAMSAIPASDSITIDPHKLGYVPYSAGVFMVAQKINYTLVAIDAPYIQYSEADHGPVTLEGSRSATGSAATWMVAKTIGLTPKGFGQILARNVQARHVLQFELSKTIVPTRVVQTTDSNVLCFVLAREGESLSVVNARTRELHRSMSKSSSKFIVSTTTLRWQHYSALCERFSRSWGAACDVHEIVLIRMCLLNPFFLSKETATFYPDAFVREVNDSIDIECL